MTKYIEHKNLQKIMGLIIVLTISLLNIDVNIWPPQLTKASMAITSCSSVQAGDNIKTPIHPAIWNIGDDNKLRPYLDGDDFKTWYSDDKYVGHFKEVSTECLASYQVATAFPLYINRRPGSGLIRLKGTSQLYVILPNNTKAPITTEAAKALYGKNFPIRDINFTSLTNYYNITNQITGSDPQPHAGMIVKKDTKKFYINPDGAMSEITASGFIKNNFKDRYVQELSCTYAATLSFGTTIGDQTASLTNQAQNQSVSTATSNNTNTSTSATSTGSSANSGSSNISAGGSSSGSSGSTSSSSGSSTGSSGSGSSTTPPATTTPTTTPTPTYSLSISTSAVNEGSTVTFTLTTTNVINGTNVAYAVSGISSSDLSAGSLSGNFQINSNQAAQLFTLSNDATTEGAETMLLSLTNGKASASVTISDTSLTPAPTPTTYGTTYYIRTDGGDASQCTGLANVAYSGSGTGQACAWKHPFIALPPKDSGLSVRITGGDTLIIANGSYKMGYGATGAVGCDNAGSYECMMKPIPSGPSADKPTKILGAGYNTGCTSKPELYGSGRPWAMIDLNGSNYVEMQCLEITDHSNCVEHHANASLRCNRDNPPYGDWASIGLRAADSKNVTLKNLDIHGLAHTGIYAGRLTDWTIENTKIEGNGWVGWDGDIDGSDSNAGMITFRKVNIDWNGCGQTYPGRLPTGCWGQTAGGYGDGLGTGDTGGNWIFEDSTFLYNTSDGLDMLYHRSGGKITVTRVRAEGNAGNQIKTNGNATITDSVIVGNCSYFNGKSFTYNADHCRAAGNALSLSMEGATGPVELYNNSVYSEGDCNIVSDSDSGSIKSRNNIYYAGTDFLQPFEKSCFFYTGTGVTIDTDYDITYQAKDNNNYCANGGSHNKCNVDPKFTSISSSGFDLRPLTTSPAIDAGTSGLTTVDYLKSSRPKGGGVDIGAYEIK